MSKKEPKTNKNGLSLSLSCITGDYRAEESSMRHEAATPLVAKEAASAASQLLMTAGMNGHDPIAYEWTVRQASRYCTHLQISMDTHTHTLWDMARWCNPLVFCVSYSPPPPTVLGLRCWPIGFRPTLQRWCEMNDRRVGEWGGHAMQSTHCTLGCTTNRVGWKCSTLPKFAGAAISTAGYWSSLSR